MIKYVDNLRKIQGAQIDTAPTNYKTMNQVFNCIHGLAANNTVFEAKLINITTKMINITVKDTVFKHLR